MTDSNDNIELNQIDMVEDEANLKQDCDCEPKKPSKSCKCSDKFDGKLRVFDIIYLTITSLLIVVMWCGGFNFMPLISVVLGGVAAVIILIRAIMNKQIGLFNWISYIVAIGGTFVFFLIWGADNFGKVLWWNLVLSMFPILLAVAILFVKQFSKDNKKITKGITILLAFLMIATALVYVLFMNLRLRPTAKNMQAGQDDYLNSLKKEKTATDSPNVLVILMDDMGYSDISSYSYLNPNQPTINTPNIDSIAENGIMMDNFYASAPVCSPSRFSMLTGRYASRGYLDNVIFPTCSEVTEGNPFPETHFFNPYQFQKNVDGILGDEITFAESLQALDYSTACIGKWNLGDYGQYLPTNQGFDYFYGSYYVNDMKPYNWVSERNGVATEVRTSKDNLDQSESTKLLTAEMVNFISSSAENNEKFLAYYTTPWPHYPIFSGEKNDTSDDTYIKCIEEFDTYLGDILQTLKDKGVYDDTLIVFTSDNGPGREGATGALRGRKNTVFEGGMKVPLLASYPNGNLGSGTAIPSTQFNIKDKTTGATRTASTKRIEASSMIFDIYPTIMRYVMGENFKMPTDRIIDGRNLYDLWQANVTTDTRVHDMLIYQKTGKAMAVQMPVTIKENGKDVTYDFKYAPKLHTENSAFIDQNYKNYLVNLDTDPIEAYYSISKTYPEVVAQCRAALDAFKKEMKTNRRGILK
ncbi:MAG: sulfatase-like hydrolase/transferase [Clostridia bacterium]